MPATMTGSAEALVGVLTEISRAIAGTLELRDVFSRVALAVSRILPFDTMGVTRPGPGRTIRLHAASLEPPEEAADVELSRDDVSEALRPHPPRTVLIADAARDLDPAFALDRLVLARGTGSLLVAPIVRGDAPLGAIFLASRQRAAFDPTHVPTLLALADLLAVPLEHQRLVEAERERQKRHRELEALVPTLAGALDVRDVFAQVSEVARRVLPHDRMSLALFAEDGRTVRIHAFAGVPAEAFPPSYEVLESEREALSRDYQIIRDVEEELDPQSPRRAVLSRVGIRSSLRVPVHLDGAIAGALSFHSLAPDAFRPPDIEIGHRVADQVALVLSHQRLAEEEQRTRDAREQAARLEARVRRLREELETRDGFGRAVGNAPTWRAVLDHASKVAPTETTVLLTGESGTGKEVIARAVHRSSPRADQPFLAINCAALPEQLLESELFGYEKGAFTGAVASRPGRLEQAAGGTLFLDEVGEMSATVQAKLLRVLQEREFQRLGGLKVLKADARIVAATNRNLTAAIARGEFREDLYYRLGVFEIHLPPLRERREDVLALTERFLEDLSRAVGRPAPGISKQARELLLAYRWPGNVRELRNALERAVILSEGGLIQVEHLPIAVSAQAPGTAAPGPLSLPPGGVDLDEVERALVEQALATARHNKSKAARLLGLTRAQLYSRLEKYGLAGR